MKNPKPLALLLVCLIPVIQSIPMTNSLILRDILPTIRFHPNLNLSETRTHIHATLTHPVLKNTTARITLSKHPLTVHIHTSTGRYLIRRIHLRNTFDDVTIEARRGTVILNFRKRVPDLGQTIRFCDIHGRVECLKELVGRVCLSSRRIYAMRKLDCDDGCVEKVLENCQREDVLAVGSRILTKLVFDGIVSLVIFVYGSGFLLAIASIPKEIVCLVLWASGFLRRIRDVGVK